MAKYEIIPGRGRVRVDNSVFGCGIAFSSDDNKHRSQPSSYEKTKAEVYATGNKWQIENFHATHD